MAHPEYGLGSTREEVTDTYFELAERLDEKPYQDVDGTAFRGYTFDSLYADASMPRLAEFWQAVDTGGPLPLPEPPRAWRT